MKNNYSRIVFFVFLLTFLTNFVLAAEKININTASSEELQKIIWIGPVMAQRIISARPFYSLDEVTKVSGIGDKKLEDIKKQGLAWAGPVLKNEKEEQFSEPLETKIIPVETDEQKDGLININTASLQGLQKIIGIGAVLGQRIIDMRPFSSLDELIKVHGIGTAILENIKNQGIAWVDPNFAHPKTEKTELSEKELAAASSPLQQIQQIKSNALSKSFPVLSAAFVLSFFSGIIILILKRSLKAFF